MKFMEKAKRFFTLNAAKHEGFTLVELIVVIAILAILAGVAVPAYSGYIKKAEKAGDMQLLAAVNEAFAAACMSEGTQAILVNSATLTWENDCIKGIATVNGAYDEGIDAAFKMFYAGNDNTAFKVLAEKLAFRNGVFGDAATDFNGSYNGKPISVSGKDVEAYLNSNWGNVASADVLGLIGSVTGAASAADSAVFTSMMSDADYLAACAATLGYSSVSDYQAALGTMVGAAVDEYTTANPDATQDDIDAFVNEYADQVAMNSAVLVAAQNAEANKGAIIDLLTKDDGAGAKAAIGTAMSNDPANGLAQASLAYGLYTSYMLDKDPNFDTSTNPDPLVVMNTLDDPDFQTYLKSDDAKTDLDGFVGALNTAASNTGNGVGQDIVQNGFANNSELAGLLQQVMGK